MKLKIIKTAFFIIGTLVFEISFCQSDKNFMKVYKAQVPLVGDISTVNDKERVSESVEYYDGLGRPVQAIQRQASPLGYDIVTFFQYDAFGAKTKSFLPYVASTTSGALNANPEQDHTSFYQALFGTADGSTAFSKQMIERSDLGRILKLTSPGAPWQANGTDLYELNDHTVKKRYRTNNPDEVIRFSYDQQTALIYSDQGGQLQFYTTGELSVVESYDEANNRTVEFTDKEGRVVCKKVQYDSDASGPLYASTYYVYDQYGNLSVVVPPEGVVSILESQN